MIILELIIPKENNKKFLVNLKCQNKDNRKP